MSEKELSIIINVSVMLGGIVLFVLMLLFLDWLGRRKERQKSQHRQA